MVLGAGGTSRAVIYALKKLRVGRISIWNRTTERARALASEFGIEVIDSLDDSANTVTKLFYILSLFSFL